MAATYSVRIVRPGMADLPELCRADSVQAGIAVADALLRCGDPDIAHVVISVNWIMEVRNEVNLAPLPAL